MIWGLHINLTVYIQYPTLAGLAYKDKVIDGLIRVGNDYILVFIEVTTPKDKAYASGSQ